MIFVVNELGEGLSMSLDVMLAQDEENKTATTCLYSNISSTTDENSKHELMELFNTTDEAVAAAINKRFKSGTSNLKCLVNRHDFFLNNRLTVATKVVEYTDNTSCIVLGSVPINLADRTDDEKKFPRNAIVVVTKESDKLEVGMNDDRNILTNTSFVSNGYKYSMIIVKWSSWKNLRHRAAIVIKDENGNVKRMLELGTSKNAADRVQDDLIPLTAEDITKFQEQEAAEAEARKKAAEERRVKNPKQVRERTDDNRGSYQNRRPNSNNGYGNRRTGVSDNRYGDRSNGGNYRGGYNGNRNNSGYRTNNNRRDGGNGYQGQGYRNSGNYRNSYNNRGNTYRRHDDSSAR